jgi:penicillin-binding protein 1A
VISPQVALEMIGMMNSVVMNGTGRRAQLDGIQVAGKTGTTNGYRDAWFVGYTGNFSGAVWMGNDDYTPTKRMTGGTIPALIWHNVMAYAHQVVELRTLAGLPPPQHAPAVTDAALQGAPAPHQILLTRKGTEALVRVEHLLDDANRAMPALTAPAGTLGEIGGGERHVNTLTTVSEQQSAGASRGN